MIEALGYDIELTYTKRNKEGGVTIWVCLLGIRLDLVKGWSTT